MRDREAVLRVIDRHFAFKVEGAIFAPSYGSWWDGKVHLIRKVRDGTLSFPAGLHDEVVDRLEAAGYSCTIDDQRLLDAGSIPGRSWSWIGPPLRGYQQEALAKALATGSGILKLPTRSGKTLLAAAIIQEIGKRALFVVTSDLLLNQAAHAFRNAIGGATVTMIGSGQWDPSGDIVVASIQTLQGRVETPAFGSLARSFGITFLDELHHLMSNGDAWREAAIHLEPPIKIGLSATVDLSKDSGDEGSIWLRGICGKIMYEIGTSDLIDQGFLVRPTIRFVHHGAEATKDRRWSPTVLKKYIVECKDRNETIAARAISSAKAGEGVLVDTNTIPHVRILADLISRGLPPGQVAILVGDTAASVRERVIESFRAGRIRAIVSTIMGEGVDVPEIITVINAEGGKAKVSTLQRLRNLTPAPGKTKAEVIEMADVHHPILRGWTADRLDIYKAERSFRIKVE
jgi:superfamily II DNA or RNA helicase